MTEPTPHTGYITVSQDPHYPCEWTAVCSLTGRVGRGSTHGRAMEALGREIQALRAREATRAREVSDG